MTHRFLCILSGLLMATSAGCGGGSGVNSGTCGNGVAETGELCDGDDLAGHTCAELNLGDGDLSCRSDCTFDVSGCSVQADCGNGILEYGEDCDATDLDNTTCQDLGYNSGTLSCTTTCDFDVSNCQGGGDCGNGTVEGAEQCDGSDLNGESCQSLGLTDGTLSCNGDCTYNIAGCSGQPECNNGAIEFPETCDGSELAGQDCLSQGYYGGTLACLADCSGFDTTNCAGTCGDDTINGTELCDGVDLGGQTCELRGYYGGTLGCAADCTAFDTSGCTGVCGDNAINGTEVCDGADLANQDCTDHGYHGGNLACLTDCTAFDITGCSGQCGDNTINGQEVCDGADLGGQTCAGLGEPPGTLACDPEFLGYDISGCVTTANAVIINEVATGAPDWVELYNGTNSTVNLAGWVLEWSAIDNGNPVTVQWTLPAYPLAADGRVLIIDEVNGSGNPPDVDTTAGTIQFHENILWNSGPGAATLYGPASNAVDFVRWVDATFAPPSAGMWADTPAPLPASDSSMVTLSRVPDAVDTNVAGDFCPALESAGAANTACLPPFNPGMVLITEIDVDIPDRVELYNPTNTPVDLEAWVIYWSSNHGTDPQGGSYLPSYVLNPGAYVVVIDDAGGGGPFVDGLGIHIYNINWSSTLNGAAYLWDPLWDGVDFVRWNGSGWGAQPPDQWADTPAPLGAVTAGLNLGRQNLTDNDVAGDWCLMADTMGAANGPCN